jgi:hypothetical protein
MARRSEYPPPKNNLCVVYEKQYGLAPRRTSCKKIPSVETVKDAKAVAYRLTRKLKLAPGNRVSCRRGAMFGPKC